MKAIVGIGMTAMMLLAAAVEGGGMAVETAFPILIGILPFTLYAIVHSEICE